MWGQQSFPLPFAAFMCVITLLCNTSHLFYVETILCFVFVLYSTGDHGRWNVAKSYGGKSSKAMFRLVLGGVLIMKRYYFQLGALLDRALHSYHYLKLPF